jgi:hypothetical protein
VCTLHGCDFGERGIVTRVNVAHITARTSQPFTPFACGILQSSVRVVEAPRSSTITAHVSCAPQIRFDELALKMEQTTWTERDSRREAPPVRHPWRSPPYFADSDRRVTAAKLRLAEAWRSAFVDAYPFNCPTPGPLSECARA